MTDEHDAPARPPRDDRPGTGGAPEWGDRRPGGDDPGYGQQHPGYGQPQPGYGQQHPGYGGPVSGGPIPIGPNGEPPRWAPWYGISFPQAVRRFFVKYARFDGRASRSEFWWWILVNGIVTIVLYGTFLAVFIPASVGAAEHYSSTSGAYSHTVYQGPSFAAYIPLILLWIWGLGTLVPNLALGWRRLHDAGMSGALWIIALFIPIVGIVFGALGSNPTGAQYDRPDLG